MMKIDVAAVHWRLHTVASLTSKMKKKKLQQMQPVLHSNIPVKFTRTPTASRKEKRNHGV
jgi:hypothetical protein